MNKKLDKERRWGQEYDSIRRKGPLRPFFITQKQRNT